MSTSAADAPPLSTTVPSTAKSSDVVGDVALDRGLENVHLTEDLAEDHDLEKPVDELASQPADAVSSAGMEDPLRAFFGARDDKLPHAMFAAFAGTFGQGLNAPHGESLFSNEVMEAVMQQFRDVPPFDMDGEHGDEDDEEEWTTDSLPDDGGDDDDVQSGEEEGHVPSLDGSTPAIVNKKKKKAATPAATEASASSEVPTPEHALPVHD